MTDSVLETRRFDRRRFLAGTGVMLVAVGAPRLLDPKSAFGALDDFPIGPALVDPAQLDSWLAVAGDGTVTLFTGKVELGTGVMTTMMQLVADELDVPLSKIKVVEGDTWRTPNQGYTAGSQTNRMQYGTAGLRQAAAEARLALLTMASASLGIPVAQLAVKDGVVSGGGKQTTYAELIGNRRFSLKQTGKAKPKSFHDYSIVGKSVPRVDVPDKVTGRFTYTQDVRVDGMVHARVVRPPTLDSQVVSVNGFKGRKPPGLIKVVVKNNFVAVVAEREEQAIQAAATLKVTWKTAPLPSYATFYDDLQKLSPTTDRVLIDTKDVRRRSGSRRRRSARPTTTRSRCTARWAPRQASHGCRARRRRCGRRRRACTSCGPRSRPHSASPSRTST
jgi:nicotinate dehydrogenase subunit B